MFVLCRFFSVDVQDDSKRFDFEFQ